VRKEGTGWRSKPAAMVQQEMSSLFPVFALSLVALIAIPWTLVRAISFLGSKSQSIQCQCSVCRKCPRTSPPWPNGYAAAPCTWFRTLQCSIRTLSTVATVHTNRDPARRHLELYGVISECLLRTLEGVDQHLRLCAPSERPMKATSLPSKRSKAAFPTKERGGFAH